MNPDRWSRIKEVFQAALDRPADQQAVFLDVVCAGDDGLRAEVTRLLAAHADAASFMEQSPAAGLAAAARSVPVTAGRGFVVPGTRLGRYEMLSVLGAGGMGEVYRARDTRLQRDVAIKVLPDILAADPERLARLTREAQLLAALNHPNIAAIYGFEEAGPVHALTLELVEGPTLADRIAHGPIPLDEALPIARQIAEALEAAHEKGIIHRDLKPPNVKVRPDGSVKVLDFGLAKGFESDTSVPTLSSLSRTFPSPAVTDVGMILGTPAYMSPEQARGKPLDKRTDIWSFGCVLYEMITGRRPFEGDEVTDVLARVLERDVDFASLPASTPTPVRRLLQRSLEKDRNRRLPDIGVARLEIDDALRPRTGAEPAASRPMTGLWSERLAWVALGAIASGLIAAVAFAIVGARRSASVQLPRIEFTVLPPDGWSVRADASEARGLALSPNGRQLAFAAQDANGRPMLWLRSLDSATPRLLRGTENGAQPFWSPDGRFIAFVADGKLKRIDVTGGPPETILEPAAGAGAWSADGTIVFSPRPNSRLYRVSSSGGMATAVTELEAGSARHTLPSLLPDGEHFVFASFPANDIYVGALHSKERKLLLHEVNQATRFSNGRLFFIRAGTLMSQQFDLATLALVGAPSSIADIRDTGAFDVSPAGIVAYSIGASLNRNRLEWFDRTGNSIGTLRGDPANYYTVELSPDGTRLAGGIGGTTLNGDLWLYDTSHGGRTRLTFDPMNTIGRAIWSPDGQRVMFMRWTNGKGTTDLFERAADGSGGERPVLSDSVNKYPFDWSRDGRFVLYGALPGTPTTGNDIWVLPMFGDKKPMPYLRTQAGEFSGRFSPDGRWVAYYSRESGQREVYVASFPMATGKRQISTMGGTTPRWRHDGQELFYLAEDNTLMAVGIDLRGASVEVTSVKPLFKIKNGVNSADFPFDVTPDGQRFIVITRADDDATTAGITVVMNGEAAVKN